MQPCEIDKLLSDYRVNKARYDHLYLEAMTMMLQINAEAIRAIANDSIHAQQYNDMPHGSKVSKPVEDLALRYMDGHLPDVLKGWMQESEEMQRELRELETNILYVDTWLGALNDKEKAVITEHMIEGKTLKEMELTSSRKFGYHMTAVGIRVIKKKALQKIYDIAR